MGKPQKEDEQRRDRALKRMLNTPPKPHKDKNNDDDSEESPPKAD